MRKAESNMDFAKIPDVIERTGPVAPGRGEIWLAGGCFWGTEEYLRLIDGVIETDVGYANGRTPDPTYEAVCRHETGYAETVRVVYDRERAPLPFLLRMYFLSIDPTSRNRQGGDIGDQYRTGIYYLDEGDLPAIEQEIEALGRGLKAPVAIEVEPLRNYYLAEEYHQKYLRKNPGGYCHIPGALFDRARTASPESE